MPLLRSRWDLSALLNAADPRASRPERHLWLTRLFEWLRRGAGAQQPLLRLKLLLNALDQSPEPAARVRALLQAFWRDIDIASLFDGVGLAPRTSLAAALRHRLGQKLLPASPDTRDLATLFPLLFADADAAWLDALDDTTLARVVALLRPDDAPRWRDGALVALTHLAGAAAAAGFAAPLRLRMEPALLADEPFAQLVRATDAVRAAFADAEQGEQGDHARALRESSYLRALLHACRTATGSIGAHLEEYGISVDVVFDADQLVERTLRIELLLDALLADSPREALRGVIMLIHAQARSRSVRALWRQHHSLLARQVTERSAETGEHYIARDGAAFRDMLRRAAGGGVVLAGTTFGKFAVFALGLSAFWTGWWAGVLYAASFVAILLLHWTVATKQPAMTAPALALKLPRGAHAGAEVEGFVDEVVHLIRSQSAGVIGNLALCAPVVLAVQALATQAFGAPLVGAASAVHVLDDLTLLGPTPLYAAFTGVLLFASSLVAGYAENWFVLHRLDSAIAWNPRIVGALGSARAQSWARWWRARVSGLAGNVALGLMLGLVPAIAGFFGLGLQVRHVTLSTGQLAAAFGALGPELLDDAAFWWCVAGIAATAVLNIGVSFWLAFRTALRSRGVAWPERSAIRAAIIRRALTRPLSFLWPPARRLASAA